jgi:RNA polymerase sigma-70 factor, ECF subfamily
MEPNHLQKDRLTRLAVRMKKGDRKAAAELYDDMAPKAYGFFFARTGRKEVAQDLSQDIFLKLVEKIGYFDETRGNFVVWFWQVARNTLVDHYREKKAVAFSSFEENEVEAFSQEEMPDLDGKLEYQKMQRFLKTLGDEERELFELRYVAETPYRDISKILGKSEGSLRVAALRVKEKIKRELKK